MSERFCNSCPYLEEAVNSLVEYDYRYSVYLCTYSDPIFRVVSHILTPECLYKSNQKIQQPQWCQKRKRGEKKMSIQPDKSHTPTQKNNIHTPDEDDMYGYYEELYEDTPPVEKIRRRDIN